MEKLTKITTGEAKDLLRKDLKRTEDGVKKLLNSASTQNQFDALVSFAFNLGVGNLKKSTLLKNSTQAISRAPHCSSKAGIRQAVRF